MTIDCICGIVKLNTERGGLMKKRFLVILFVVFAICSCALFAACGEKTDTPNKPDTPPEGKTYTVTYVTNGGGDIAPVTVNAGESATLPVPVKSGSKFVGWYDGEGSDAVRVSSPYTPTKSVTLYARWTEDENYYVQFDVNGGQPVIAYSTKKKGETVAEPEEPTRVGYEFGGWYSDVGCTRAATFPYTVNGDVDFYAKWTGTRSVTVNYKICERRANALPIDYDRSVLDPTTIAAGEKLEQPEDPEDITYTDGGGKVHTLKFSYWNFRPTYQSDWTKAVLFPISNTADVAEITIYAVYTEISAGGTYAKLTVHPENGEKDTVMYGEMGKALAIAPLDATDPSPFYSDSYDPFREGYEATGYYKTREFDSQHIYAVPFMLENANNDVYIRWAARDEVTVTFDKGMQEKDEVSVLYGGKVERPANPSRAGYTFDGWLATPYAPAVEEYRWDFEHDRVKRNTVLKAKWIKTATVITFDTGCSIVRNPVAVSVGTSLSELPALSRNDGNNEYAFLGWYVDDGLNTKAELPYKVEGDATFYAKWSAPVDVSKLEFLTNGINYSVRVRDEARATIEGTVVIPSSYKGTPVAILESKGFENCTKITEVILPESVEYLYNQVFVGCTSLKKVVLSDNTVQIGQNVFKGCENLEEINFPQNKRLINLSANIFQDCPKMWDKLEEVNGMFYWGTSFLGNNYYVKGSKVADTTTKTLIVRDGTTIIASNALYYMSALEEFTLAPSVRYITWWAFPLESESSLKRLNLSSAFMTTSLVYWTKKLESITVPSDNLYYEVVDGCLMYKLEKRLTVSTINATKIPEGTVIIGEQSFRSKNLETVTIPDTVTTIRSEAFAGCAFKSINIPDSVGILDSSAFKDCKNMEQMRLGEKTNLQTKELFKSMTALNTLEVSEKNSSMLAECSVLYNKLTGDIIHAAPAYKGALTLRDSVTTIPRGMFHGTYTVFTLSDRITGIEEAAFEYAKIDKLVIGKNVPEVGAEYLTWGLSASNYINALELSPENKNMKLAGGVLYNSDMTKLLLAPTSLKTLVIPDSVVEVDTGNMLWSLDSLTIGRGITHDKAIEYLYGADSDYVTYAVFATKSVSVSPDHPELAEFGGILYTKNKQRLVYIPYGFNGAFVLPKEMPALNQAVFAYSSPLYIENGEIGAGKVTLTSLSVEQGSALTSIAGYVFGNPSSIYEDGVDKPYWVDNLNDFVGDIERHLKGAVDLTGATQLVSIGDNSFAMTEIVSVALPDSLQTIGYGAFANCPELATVSGDFVNVELKGMTFNRSPKLFTDGWLVFDGVLVGCDSDSYGLDADLVIPDTVTAIRKDAVYATVRSVTVPASVVTASERAFWPTGNAGTFIIYMEAAAVPQGFAKDEEGKDIWYSEQWRTVSLVLDCKSDNPVGNRYYTDPVTGMFYELTPDGEARLISDASATEAWKGDVTLPEKITYLGRDYTLTAIGDSALNATKQNEDGGYSYLSGEITSFTIPSTVTELGKGSLSGLKSVEELVIPDSVTVIARQAISSAGFKKVTVGSGITALPAYMFSNCAALETVVLRGEVTEIGDWCFYSCKLLKNIDLSHVTVVGDTAFAYCALLAPESVGGLTKIGRSAFNGCKLVTTVTFADGLETIPSSAFSGSGITSVTLPASVKLIDSSAFSGCADLVSVKIEGGALEIGSSAFSGCTSLASFTSKGSITSVGYAAFGYAYSTSSCTKLASFDVEGGIGSIGENAFRGCKSLSSITLNGVTSVGKYALSGTALVTVVFDSVVTVDSNAFDSCPELTSVSFGNLLKTVGASAFNKCVKLTSVDFGDSTGVTIGSSAFTGLTNLETIACGGSFANIGNQAFYKCSTLSVDSLTLKGTENSVIGDYAFRGTRLKTLVIDGIANIGQQAFYGISALTDVTVRNYDGMTIGKWAFGATGLKSFVFDPETEGTVARIVQQAFYNITSECVVRLCDIAVVEDYTFINCPNLTVYVPFAEGEKPSGWASSWNYKNTAAVVYAQKTDV